MTEIEIANSCVSVKFITNIVYSYEKNNKHQVLRVDPTLISEAKYSVIQDVLTNFIAVYNSNYGMPYYEMEYDNYYITTFYEVPEDEVESLKLLYEVEEK